MDFSFLVMLFSTLLKFLLCAKCEISKFCLTVFDWSNGLKLFLNEMLMVFNILIRRIYFKFGSCM